MKRIILVFLSVIGVLALFTVPASAQTRTWVSGVGDDLNPCSRVAPCKTFAGAISKTATGGEINCLDSGGFGALTITKSISVICEGVIAGVSAPDINGFIVNAPNAVVYLSGLDINGFGTGVNGIRILQAAQVTIKNTTIRGFRGGNGAGIDIEPSVGGILDVFVHNTIVTNSLFGIFVQPAAGLNTNFFVKDVVLTRNTRGVRANGNVIIGQFNNVVITDNVFGVDLNAGAQLISSGNNSLSFNGADTPAANGAFTSVRALQ